MNRRRVGAEKEARAAEYLSGLGMQILEKNFRSRYAEIDLIARDGDTIVFFEVKYRKNKAHGLPEEAVAYQKTRRISRAADFYRVRYQISDDTPVRFDVIAIEGEDLRHYINAFPYVPYK